MYFRESSSSPSNRNRVSMINLVKYFIPKPEANQTQFWTWFEANQIPLVNYSMWQSIAPWAQLFQLEHNTCSLAEKRPGTRLRRSWCSMVLSWPENHWIQWTVTGTWVVPGDGFSHRWNYGAFHPSWLVGFLNILCLQLFVSCCWSIPLFLFISCIFMCLW